MCVCERESKRETHPGQKICLRSHEKTCPQLTGSLEVVAAWGEWA